MSGVDEQRKAILNCQGHLLVTGGPGAGKTTIALHKALKCIEDATLKGGQRILFLSFARSTVARIIEAARRELSRDVMRLIDIDTYHGFAWRLIRRHSYLTNGLTPKLLPPPDIAALFADVPVEIQANELQRLWREEGLIGFDLFPIEAERILTECRRIGEIYSSKFPVIIIDEFQDTSPEQYALIRALSNNSQVIALADPDQRIYDFAGADPKRIGEFIDLYQPEIVDLVGSNHRSGGTDITQFGNDLLSGANRGREYEHVKVKGYNLGKGRASPDFALKAETISAMRRLIANGDPWSLAILVPSQSLMLSTAKYLSSTEDDLPSIGHQVHVDQEGPCLAAAVIAGLLEQGTPQEIFERLLEQLRTHVRGRKGRRSNPSQADLGFAVSISDLTQVSAIKKKDQKATLEACARIANACADLRLSGAPEDDWRQVIELLRAEDEPRIAKVADDARYIRLLKRGSALKDRMNELWRQFGDYRGARGAVEVALTQLHLANNAEEVRGIHVMTIHKSKGKEYDEVILFEGPYQGRYLYQETKIDIARTRLVLRVGVTRARQRATVLTPGGKKTCPLL